MRAGQDAIVAAIADQYAGSRCWLDGKEAKVAGRLERFAHVGTLDGAQSVEFSWHAVNHVMRERGGEFRS